MGTTGKQATHQAQTWVTSHIREPIKTEIGNVEVDKNTIKNTLNHKRYPAKYDTIVALKPLLERGVYLGNMKDLDGECDLNNHYFAGRVSTPQGKKIVFCRVRDSRGDTESPRFYFQDIIEMEDIIKQGAIPHRATTALAMFVEHTRCFMTDNFVRTTTSISVINYKRRGESK